jgi:hypothetical protein
MFKFKRSLRVAVPVLFLMLGAAVSATIPVSAASCNRPEGVTKFLQAVGLAHAQPCEVMVLPSFPGEICANPGHHCNDGSGPGKCQSNYDPTAGQWSCQCLK